MRLSSPNRTVLNIQRGGVTADPQLYPMFPWLAGNVLWERTPAPKDDWFFIISHIFWELVTFFSAQTSNISETGGSFASGHLWHRSSTPSTSLTCTSLALSIACGKNSFLGFLLHSCSLGSPMSPALKCKSQEIWKCWENQLAFYKLRNFGWSRYGPQRPLKG